MRRYGQNSRYRTFAGRRTNDRRHNPKRRVEFLRRFFACTLSKRGQQMNREHDPFHHHPELSDKITDPLTSFFRTFRIESVLEKHPELEWVGEFLHSDETREQSRQTILKDHPGEDLWVFAYGSLMWDPAFRFFRSSSGVAARLLTSVYTQRNLWRSWKQGTARFDGCS